jgi:uncharacterized protein YecT (DUF1311 family)
MSALVLTTFAIFLMDARAQSYGECSHVLTRTDITACLVNAISKVDAALAERRKKIEVSLQSRPQLLDLFRKSESQWNSFRTTTCDELTSQRYEGGTIQVNITMGCHLDATSTHVEFLGRLFYQQLK